ncbi:MAG: ATP-binding protein [Candidatus Altiarchaeota archaeon]|nr:ATP-binding protein [Candidatus Altiarchaeota archaeon]
MSLILGRSKSMIKKYGADRAMYLGKSEGVPLFIDSIKPHVMFVCGARGSGKSYTMGVVMEELAEHNDAVASIVIDPIGVFWSMKLVNRMDKEIEALTEWEMSPKAFKNVRVLVPVGAKNMPKESYDGFFSLKPSELRAQDWCFTFDLDRFSPAGLLLDLTIQKAGDGYTVDDLTRIISTDPDFQSKERGFSKQTRRGLISRLDASKGWGIFSDTATRIEMLARAGKMTIIDTSFLEESVAALIVGLLARKILERRKAESRKEALGKPSSFPPVWLFIDEAHTLVPKDRKTAASDSLIEYVKQGRKPGCSLVVATQQPSAINSEVLSQLDLMFVHQLVFEDDIKAVKKRMPARMPKAWNLNFIRGIRLGQAIIGDRETTSTHFLHIRPRMSQHEGRSALAIKKPELELEDEPIQTQEQQEQKKELMKVPEKEIRKIPIVQHRMDIEAAEKIAAKKLDKLLFIRQEHFTTKIKVCWPYWLIKYVGRDGTGEFLFDGIFGEVAGSKGLQQVQNLSPLAIKIMSKTGSPSEIAKKVGAEPRAVKLQLNKMSRLGLMKIKSGRYSSIVKIPSSPPEFEGDVKNEPPEGRILKPLIEPSDKLLALWGIKPVSKELVYVIYAYFKTDKRKKIWVNLLTSELEKRRVNLRI